MSSGSKQVANQKLNWVKGQELWDATPLVHPCLQLHTALQQESTRRNTLNTAVQLMHCGLHRSRRRARSLYVKTLISTWKADEVRGEDSPPMWLPDDTSRKQHSPSLIRI